MRWLVGANAPAEQRLADLEKTLRTIGLDPAEYAPLLAPLADIPLPPGRATNLSSEELRRRQLAAITAPAGGQMLRMITIVTRDGPDREVKNQHFILSDDAGTVWLAHR